MKTLCVTLLLAAAVAADAQTYSLQQTQPVPVTYSPATSQASMTQLINDMSIRQANQNAAAINSLQLIQRPVVIITPKPAVKSAK